MEPINTTAPHEVETTEYTTRVTYSNVIFVPNAQQENSLIDPSQAYILSSDSRLFNSYVRSKNDSDITGTNAAQYEGHVIRETDIESIEQQHHNHHQHHHHHQHHQQQLSGYHMQQFDENETAYIETVTTTQNGLIQNEVIATGMSEQGTEGPHIIIQGSDGQFYRQIQNVYLNDVPLSVELVPLNSDENMYEQNAFDSNYEQATTTMEISNRKSDTINAAAVLLPTVADAELLLNNSYNHYKNEYTVLEPMNRQLMPQHVQHMRQLVPNCKQISMAPSTVDSLDLREEQQRILLESTMSPLCKYFFRCYLFRS